MAKYGDFLYSTALYGTGAEDPQPTFNGAVAWIVMIDWDGDGVFDGTNEAGRLVNCEGERGRRQSTDASGNGFEPVAAGRCVVTLDNYDGRYDVYNASGPLYGNIKPGRKAVVAVKYLATDTNYVLMTGKVTDIRPESGPRGHVKIEIYDAMRDLENKNITLDGAFNVAVTSAIEAVLNAAEYADRDIKADDQLITYFAPDGDDALTVCQQLAASALGTFFIDRAGRPIFYDRTFNAWTTHSLDQSVLGKNVIVGQPWDTIRNDVQVTASQYKKSAYQNVWSLTKPKKFSGFGGFAFYADMSDNEGGIYSPQVQSKSANTAVDGSGVDITNQTSVFLGGTRKKLYVSVLNKSTAAGYMTALSIKARVLQSLKTMQVEADTGSIADYGRRRFQIEPAYLTQTTHAAAFATAILAHLKDAQVEPVVTIIQRPDIMYSYELFDQVDLTIGQLGIDDSYNIGGLSWVWNDDTGQDVTMTLYLQKLLVLTGAIDSDPTIPTDPDIPDDPNDDDPDDPYPQLQDCFNDLAFPPNGPYDLDMQGYLQSDGDYWQARREFPCAIRAGSATNKSQVVVNGILETWDLLSASWVPTNATTGVYVKALDNNHATLQTATTTRNGNTWTFTFTPGAATDIWGFRLELQRSTGGETVTEYATAAYETSYNPYSLEYTNTNNTLGAPDGLLNSCYKPTNLGAGGWAVSFGGKEIPAPFKVFAFGRDGVDTGIYAPNYYGYATLAGAIQYTPGALVEAQVNISGEADFTTSGITAIFFLWDGGGGVSGSFGFDGIYITYQLNNLLRFRVQNATVYNVCERSDA